VQLTPAQVQQRLYDMHNQLAQAADALKLTRDAEVEAAEALRMAVVKATLSEDCPKPKRGENGVTVADRDAWVDRQVADERFAHAVAEATRKAAEDRLRVSRDQASLVQSLSASMRAEMSLAGAQPGA
jgi:hypothetical protein